MFEQFAKMEEDSLVIRPVPKDTSHRICTGQVILSLAAACKELVENALDAGAKNIELRLEDYGTEVLELSDDGTGIAKEDFENLCKAHGTSKLRQFEDLGNMHTYGFRGEALNALCAMRYIKSCLIVHTVSWGNFGQPRVVIRDFIARVMIVTRHSSQDVGYKLEFDQNGLVIQETPTPRQIGTTVTVLEMFIRLPVRRKELCSNKKREYSRLISSVQAIALMSPNVRFNCHHRFMGGNRQDVLVKAISKSLYENIGLVLGSKVLSTMVKVIPKDPDDELRSTYNVREEELKRAQVNLDGYVSSSQHGSGRSNSERQFIFVNNRWCEYQKMSKVVNDVYRQYNRYQYPVLVLNISVAPDSVDVNVTPDKRRVYLAHERAVLCVLVASLRATFDSLAGLCPTVPPPAATANKPHKRSSSSTSKAKTTDSRPANQPALQAFDFTSSSDEQQAPKRTKMAQSHTSDETVGNENTEERVETEPPMQCLRRAVQKTTTSNLFDLPPGIDLLAGRLTPVTDGEETAAATCMNDKPTTPVIDASVVVAASSIPSVGNERTLQKHKIAEPNVDENTEPGRRMDTDHWEQTEPEIQIIQKETKPDFNRYVSRPRKKRQFNTTIELMEEKILAFKPVRRILPVSVEDVASGGAEALLTKILRKSDFDRMEVFGQFNLGFILARLDDDLFILDQHACDEKHNFEYLQDNATIQKQLMLIPKPLQLNALSESVLLHNMDVFERNGFTFNVSQEGVPGQRVKVTAVPELRGHNFNENDIEEMIDFLTECPGVFCRPKKIRNIFASKACRKSIMIGTALDRRQMTKVVRNLAKLRQPWNCPHGRPTLRHLLCFKKETPRTSHHS